MTKVTSKYLVGVSSPFLLQHTASFLEGFSSEPTSLNGRREVLSVPNPKRREEAPEQTAETQSPWIHYPQCANPSCYFSASSPHAQLGEVNLPMKRLGLGVSTPGSETAITTCCLFQ